MEACEMLGALACPVETCLRHRQPFSSKSNLQQHMHSLHSGRPHACDKCGRSFGLRYRCAAHQQECGFKFRCSACGKQLPSSQALELHCRRSKHRSKPAREQLVASRWLSADSAKKKEVRQKGAPLLKPDQLLRPSPVYLKALSHSLVNQLVSQRNFPLLVKKKKLRDMSTQTNPDPPPEPTPVPPSYPPIDPHFPLFPPSPLLLSDIQTQTHPAESHTEAVQTNPVVPRSPSTEHAQVQTQLSYESWSPDWLLFSHAHPDNLFDFGTQTYESLLGQELGLMDSSVQTYF